MSKLFEGCWFVTGTDTEIGKTYTTERLLRALNRSGIAANGYKPVASGSEETEFGLKNPDAVAHLLASHTQLPYEMVNPYFFEEADAPHLLSERLNQPIQFSVMTEGLKKVAEKGEVTLVEGAGGWYTPLSKKQTFADWVAENHLPVIVVVGLKLGVINHALLTFDAIRARGLTVAGWIANHLSDAKSLPGYIEGIQRFTDIPLIGEIPYSSEESDVSFLSGSEGCFDLSLFALGHHSSS